MTITTQFGDRRLLAGTLRSEERMERARDQVISAPRARRPWNGPPAISGLLRDRVRDLTGTPVNKRLLLAGARCHARPLSALAPQACTGDDAPLAVVEFGAIRSAALPTRDVRSSALELSIVSLSRSFEGAEVNSNAG